MISVLKTILRIMKVLRIKTKLKNKLIIFMMSYGWLTESSLLAGKKQKINVESKTFLHNFFKVYEN